MQSAADHRDALPRIALPVQNRCKAEGQMRRKSLKLLARPERFELPAPRFVV